MMGSTAGIMSVVRIFAAADSAMEHSSTLADWRSRWRRFTCTGYETEGGQTRFESRTKKRNMSAIHS